ncbi:hypothetical protein CRENBAI_008228 [Crenichthys baileyi]|uniref:Uncharacterized protein n=1 Tax=Crenichthys baileyi TaxID=28760 RepID=A0AAV9R4X9_9TELE
MDHPAHYHAQGKTQTALASQKGATADAARRPPPIIDADHQHPVRGQSPTQAQSPSDARPAAPTPGGQSRHAQDPPPPTPQARNTAEDRMQQRAPRAKAAHKTHTGTSAPPPAPQNKAPRESARPMKRRSAASRFQEHARHPYPCCQKQPRKEAHPEAHKGKESPRTKSKPSGSQDRSSRDQPRARPRHLNHATPSKPPSPDRKGPASVTGKRQGTMNRDHPGPNNGDTPFQANHPFPPQKET